MNNVRSVMGWLDTPKLIVDHHISSADDRGRICETPVDIRYSYKRLPFQAPWSLRERWISEEGEKLHSAFNEFIKTITNVCHRL